MSEPFSFYCTCSIIVLRPERPVLQLSRPYFYSHRVSWGEEHLLLYPLWQLLIMWEFLGVPLLKLPWNLLEFEIVCFRCTDKMSTSIISKVRNLWRMVKQNGGIRKSLATVYRTDDLKWGTHVGTDRYGNKYYENNFYMYRKSQTFLQHFTWSDASLCSSKQMGDFQWEFSPGLRWIADTSWVVSS